MWVRIKFYRKPQTSKIVAKSYNNLVSTFIKILQIQILNYK